MEATWNWQRFACCSCEVQYMGRGAKTWVIPGQTCVVLSQGKLWFVLWDKQQKETSGSRDAPHLGLCIWFQLASLEHMVLNKGNWGRKIPPLNFLQVRTKNYSMTQLWHVTLNCWAIYMQVKRAFLFFNLFSLVILNISILNSF